MIWICLTTDPCPTRSTLRCREGSDEDFLFADYLTRFPFSPCCPTRATLHSGCPPLLGKELHEEPLQKCWGQLTLGSAVVSQLPEQKTVNLAERYSGGGGGGPIGDTSVSNSSRSGMVW